MTRPRWPRGVFTTAIWNSDLLPSRRLVALSLADQARHHPVTVAMPSALAYRTRLHRSTVRRALEDLVTQGWLTPVEHLSRMPHYVLTVPANRPQSRAFQRAAAGGS